MNSEEQYTLEEPLQEKVQRFNPEIHYRSSPQVRIQNPKGDPLRRMSDPDSRRQRSWYHLRCRRSNTDPYIIIVTFRPVKLQTNEIRFIGHELKTELQFYRRKMFGFIGFNSRPI
jgi:hypothetical protein